MDLADIETLNAYATQGLTPNLTVLLDLDPAIGLSRQRNRTRMEDEALPFHQRIRDGFLALAAREPSRFLVLDSSQDAAAVADALWATLAPLLTTP